MRSWRSSSRRSRTGSRELASGLVLGVVLGLALATSGGPRAQADPITDRELETRRNQVFEDPSLQTELPGWKGSAAEERSSSGRRADGSGAPGSSQGRDWEVPNPISPALLGGVGQILGWALLVGGGVVLVVLLAWLVSQLFEGLGKRRARPRGSEDEGGDEGDAAREDPWLGGAPRDRDLDRLLQAGDYGAAVHLLLLRAVRRLIRHGGRRIPVGRTSREVLATAGLETTSRESLRELVLAVERYLFGGRRLAREDYERCRDAFQRLESSLEGGSDPTAPTAPMAQPADPTDAASLAEAPS